MLSDCKLEWQLPTLTGDTSDQYLITLPKRLEQGKPNVRGQTNSRLSSPSRQGSHSAPRPAVSALEPGEFNKLCQLGPTAPRAGKTTVTPKKDEPPLQHQQQNCRYQDFPVAREKRSRPQTTATRTRTKAPINRDFFQCSNLAGSDANSQHAGQSQGRGEREGERAGAGGGARP